MSKFPRNTTSSPLFYIQDTFKAVTGKFTVPTPKKPSGSSGSHAASAWVGIDGDACETAILQTSVNFTISKDDEISFDGIVPSYCFLLLMY
jgi:hypothetical protein